MNVFIPRTARTLAVAALLGTTAFATADAADWDKLNKWEGGQAEAGANAGGDADAEGMATASPEAAGGAGAEIATAFEDLGMDAARAACFGRVLSSELSGSDLETAAELVRTASNGADVQSAVMNEGPTMVGGFSAANTSCPEGAGG